MIFKSASFIEREIEKTNQLIRETGYEGEIEFRPPNGKKLIGFPYYLKKHHIQTITWNLEPDTYYTAVSEIESLSQDGYRFVTVNELWKVK